MSRRFRVERRRDPYYRAAQAEGLRSRAAFKLAFLSRKYPIFREGDRVLDLGAAPGGWSVVAREILGRSGEVVSVDPRPMDPVPGVRYVRGEVGDPRLPQKLGGAPFDVVLSDMSPHISGAYSTDQARSVDLVRSSFSLARTVLTEGGSFVAKVFQGDLLDGLEREIAPAFRQFHRTKPPASRDHSSEIYLVGLGFHRPRPVPS